MARKQRHSPMKRAVAVQDEICGTHTHTEESDKASEFDHWPENYSKESADVDQQQDVAHLVGDKNPQGNAKRKQQFGAVPIRHNKCRRGPSRAPGKVGGATRSASRPIAFGGCRL